MKETEILLLVEYLAKATLVLGIGFLILRPLRRQVAAVKHRVWIGLFVAVIMLPAVLALPRWGFLPGISSSAPATAAEVPVIPATPQRVPNPGSIDSEKGQIAAEAASMAGHSIRWGSIFVTVWLIGVVAVAARMFIAWMLLSRLRTGLRPVPAHIRCAADDLLLAYGVKRNVSIGVSDQVATPFVWGACSPRIVLPEAVETWSVAEVDMVLRHELAHVKRWDAASLLVSRWFFALNWVNPMAWIASRQAMKLREEACDLMVLAGGHRQSDYAVLLLAQAKLSNRAVFRSATISMADRANVEGRIRQILTSPASAAGTALTADSRSQRRTSSIALASVVVVTFIIGLAGVSQAQRDASESADTVATSEIVATERKLDAIILPKLELNDTPLGDAVAFLRQRSVELDGSGEPGKRGVNFVLQGYDEKKKIPTITLKLTNVPLRDAVRYITDLAQRDFTVEADAVVISGQRKGQELTVLRSLPSVGKGAYSEAEKAKLAALEKKLKTIVLPSIEFSNTPLKSAIDFIVQKSVELDAAESDVQKKGINCVLVGDPKELQSIRISVKITNAPIGEILRYTLSLAGMGYQVQPNAVVIAAQAESEVAQDANQLGASEGADRAAVAAMEKKMKNIRIPSLEFVDTPLPAALQFLRQRSFELDVDEKDPANKGVNVILGGNPKGVGNGSEYPKLTLKLSNVSLFDAFRYTANLTKMEFRIEPHAIVLSRIVEEDEK